MPDTTQYMEDDVLSLTGMVITATFTNGKTAVITNYTTTPKENSALEKGTQTIIVSYTKNSVTVTTSFTIEVKTTTVSWATGSDAEIVAMVQAADNGEITLSDYWSVGDERIVSLPSISSTNVGEYHSAQTVTLILLNVGGKTLTNGKECSFIVGLKDCLNEKGYMNSSDTNNGSWENSKRRKWCNNEFKTAMLSTGIGAIFKQHKNITATTYNGTSLTTSTDWFALPAEREIFGEGYGYSGDGYANDTEAACTDIVQFSYYTDRVSRIKTVNNSASYWWGRSPSANDSYHFCSVNSNGYKDHSFADLDYGLAPIGCI